MLTSISKVTNPSREDNHPGQQLIQTRAVEGGYSKAMRETTRVIMASDRSEDNHTIKDTALNMKQSMSVLLSELEQRWQ